MRVESGWISDVGRKRKSNEDNYCADDEQGLYVVADGMGGHAAGEVASEVAVETIEKFIQMTSDSQDATWPYGLDEKLSFNGNRLKTSIRFANKRVLERTREQAEYEGMATTVVATLINDDQADIAHVGDSRLYLIRQGQMQRLTDDHSWVNEQVLSGVMDVDQARTHPLRNVVTRALGGKEELEVDVQTLQLQSMDLLLLCSDGLTSMLDDGQILEIILADVHDKKRALSGLVEAANESGGEDNTTAILLSLHDD